MANNPNTDGGTSTGVEDSPSGVESGGVEIGGGDDVSAASETGTDSHGIGLNAEDHTGRDNGAESGVKGARGRPRLSDEEKEKRRTERSASRPARAKVELDLNLTQLKAQIELLHFMFAKMAGDPIFILDDKEAVMLTKATQALFKEFAFVVSPRALAINGMIGAVAAIHVPKVITYAKTRGAMLRAKQNAARAGLKIVPNNSPPPDGVEPPPYNYG